MGLIVLAQDGAAPAGGAGTGGGGGGFGGLGDILLPILLIWVIFWLLVFRPQKKAQQALKDAVESLKKGDRVRTKGGILGKVSNVKDNEVTLRVDLEGKMQVRFAKDAIEQVLTAPDGGGDEKQQAKKK